MMDNLEIITTSDGSHTLRNKGLNETYHSVHGAMQESLYVFIRNGLVFFHQARQPERISVLEIGFGTGLNAWLTLQYAVDNKIGIHYTTLEPFPLPEEVWSKLNYVAGNRQHFNSLHEAPWNQEISLEPRFIILKQKISLQEVAFHHRYDVIFFDAFAPSVQPELWGFDALKKVVDQLNEGGVFVTYSAKGQLKRDLKALGLAVETLPGPPGKNEMVRGIKFHRDK